MWSFGLCVRETGSGLVGVDCVCLGLEFVSLERYSSWKEEFRWWLSAAWTKMWSLAQKMEGLFDGDRDRVFSMLEWRRMRDYGGKNYGGERFQRDVFL